MKDLKYTNLNTDIVRMTYKKFLFCIKKFHFKYKDAD